MRSENFFCAECYQGNTLPRLRPQGCGQCCVSSGSGLGWPCSTPTLVSHLRRRRVRGPATSPVWAGFQPNPFPASQLPPPLSLCLRVLPTRGNICMKEWLLCVITVITLSSFTGKVPCSHTNPPTPTSKDHTVSFVYNRRFVSLLLGALVPTSAPTAPYMTTDCISALSILQIVINFYYLCLP